MQQSPAPPFPALTPLLREAVQRVGMQPPTPAAPMQLPSSPAALTPLLREAVQRSGMQPQTPVAPMQLQSSPAAGGTPDFWWPRSRLKRHPLAA